MGYLIFIITVLLVVALVWVAFSKVKEDRTFRMVSACVVWYVLGLMIILAYTNKNSVWVYQYETREILSAELTPSVTGNIHGTFVLGTGSVNGSIETIPLYSFYLKGNGGYMLKSIPSDKCVIIFQDDRAPYIEYRSTKKRVYWYSEPKWWMRPWKYCGFYKKGCEEHETAKETRWEPIFKYEQHYKLHIPSSSIIKSYNLSLSK